MEKTNGDLLISGILELIRLNEQELSDKIYLNLQIIKALRMVQNKNENELVKFILENEIKKLWKENDEIAKIQNDIKPLKSFCD